MSKTNLALSNSSAQDWRTPPELFAFLDAKFSFTVDAAASEENALCRKYWTEQTNGLLHSWKNERVFYNPPHNDVTPWITKALAESLHCGSVGLVPARTEARWFTELAAQGWIVFLTPRVNYVPPKGVKASSHAMGSCLVVIGSLFGVYPSPVKNSGRFEIARWKKVKKDS